MDLLRFIRGNQRASTTTGDATPVVLDADGFRKLVSSSELPVVVDFWAEWCGPCHMLAPSVAKLARQFEGRAVVGKLNADEHSEILNRYGVMGIPTLIYFKGGKEVDRVVGYNPYNTLRNKLTKLTSG